MNELSPQAQTQGFDVALAGNLVNAIDNLADRMSVGGIQYVKYKQGDWLIGKDQDTFPENKFEAIPNLPQLQHGWVCWKDGQLVDEHWVTVGDALPEKDQLTDHGPYSQGNDGWSENFRFDLKILATHGIPDEINAQFTGSSKGAQSAIGNMMKQWVRDCKSGDAQGKVPVVLFDSGSYQNKKYGGKTHIPTMTISRYISMDAGDQGELPLETPEAAEPKKASKKKPSLEE